MKNKIKKIFTATIISAVSFTAVGCGTNNSKLAKNIDHSMAEFITSINNLDYVETGAKATTSNEKVGKIVETASMSNDSFNTSSKLLNNNNDQFLNKTATSSYLESTITKPQERTDNFKLFVLSESPFITLTSNDNNANLNFSVKFSTNKIEETSTEIESKINTLILKRSILMIYVNEIYNGNVNLSDENKIAINAYVNVIKENTSFLNGNRGMVKNQLKLASDLVNSEQNENLVNYYIIKSGEALETRVNKLNSSIEAIDSIIDIIESNLSNSSSYYQTNLSNTYKNILSHLSSSSNNSDISKDSSNEDIAKSIAESLNFTNLETIPNQTDINSSPQNLNNNIKNSTNSIEEHKVQNVPYQSNNKNTQMQTNNAQNQTNINNNANTLNNNSRNQTDSKNLNNKTIKRRQNRRNRSQQQNSIQNISPNNASTQTNDVKNTNLLGNNNLNNNTNNNLNITTYPSQIMNNQQNNTFQSHSNDNIFKQGPLNQTNSNSINANESTNKNNTEESKSMLDRDNEEQKIMRARRTPEQIKNEEYTSARMSNIDMETNRATHVPYRTQNKF